MRTAFEQSIRAQFDYRPSYETYRYGLLPRWHGSEAALRAFGRACLATERFDTNVPWQMYGVTRAIAADQMDPNRYYARAPWSDLQRMFDGYLSKGDRARHDYYLSAEAVIACKRWEPSVADLLQQLDYKIDPQIAEEWDLPAQYAARMATLAGPAGKLLTTAERADRNHPEVALQNFLAAQKIPNLPPVSAEYLDDRIAESRAATALRAAPWRPLTPAADLSGWKTESGTWRAAGPNELDVNTEPAGAFLSRLEPIGDTWEIRGEITLSNAATGGRAEAALFCGPAGDQQHHGFSIRFFKRRDDWTGVSFARGFRRPGVQQKIGSAKNIPFFIRLANHRLWIEVNNNTWYADQPLPDGVTIDANSILALGSTGGGERSIQFRKLEWRAPAQHPNP